jgi:hypothetical protein
MPRITKLKVTHHALIQLGSRCGVAVSRKQVQDGMQSGAPLFATSHGTVYAAPIAGSLCFLIVEDSVVLTAITALMAFSDCPKAVFCYLIKTGNLRTALRLRARLHIKGVTGKGEVHKIIDRDAEIIWRAFVWTGRRK